MKAKNTNVASFAEYHLRLAAGEHGDVPNLTLYTPEPLKNQVDENLPGVFALPHSYGHKLFALDGERSSRPIMKRGGRSKRKRSASP